MDRTLYVQARDALAAIEHPPTGRVSVQAVEQCLTLLRVIVREYEADVAMSQMPPGTFEPEGE